MSTVTVLYRPVALITDVMQLLRDAGLPIDDEPDDEQAFLAACSLLMAIGVQPVIDAEDTSRGAELMRDLLLERKTHVRTRSRRAI